MSSAKFTLFGCERYFNSINQSLFDNLRVPEGLTKEALTNNILMRGGEFEVMYGDPEFMRFAIGTWSDKWMPTMQRWVDALAIEYNPLENYDRMEDWTDNTERSDATSQTSSTNRSETSAHDESEAENNTSTETGTESATYSQSDAKSGTGTNNIDNTTDRDKFNSPPKHTTTKSAFDSNSYEPYMQESDTGKWQETSEGTTTSNESSATQSDSSNNSSSVVSGASSKANSGTGSATFDESATNDSSSAMNNDSIHSGRIHGNIGVTTSQQMLLQELDLGYWNIYEKTTELFLQEFTIPVYS